MRGIIVATSALRAKKTFEAELDSIAGRRLTLEAQVGQFLSQYSQGLMI